MIEFFVSFGTDFWIEMHHSECIMICLEKLQSSDKQNEQLFWVQNSELIIHSIISRKKDQKNRLKRNMWKNMCVFDDRPILNGILLIVNFM